MIIGQEIMLITESGTMFSGFSWLVLNAASICIAFRHRSTADGQKFEGYAFVVFYVCRKEIMDNSSSRKYYLDWLRLFALTGIFGYTAAMPFTNQPWLISNHTDSLLLNKVVPLLQLWAPALFFFSAGAVASLVNHKRSRQGVVLLWLRRLFIPFIVGLLIIVPPQVYLERLCQGYDGSFWQFYGSVFHFKLYPEENTSWQHLWLLAYMALYEIILFRVAHLLSHPGFRWLSLGGNIYCLLFIPLVWGTLTSCGFQDPGLIIWWLLLATAGFLCTRQPELTEQLRLYRRSSLLLALCTIMILRWLPQTLLATLSRPLSTWLIVFTITGYAKQYLHQHRLLSYTNQFLPAFYILQQTLVVGMTWYLLPLNSTPLLKYLFIILTTYLTTIILFNIVISGSTFLRCCFGVKPRQPVVATGKVVKVALPDSCFFY
ncbi:hypothetical protein UNH65_32175 [Chitinophaga sp. 180180018-2]|nr:hypothetical protein [Chitinophaga sp. 212800010-3]